MNRESAVSSDDGATQHIQRVLRALRISGRRLVKRNDRWQVRVDGRRWPTIDVPSEEVELLLADGMLVAAGSGGFVLTAAAVEEVTAADPEEAPRAGPWIYATAGRRGAPHGFAGLAFRAERGEGPLTLRQALAGLKLVADAEQAGRDSTITMNWEAGPVDKRRRGGHASRRLRAAQAADRRLRRAREVLGADFTLLWRACVEQVPLSRLSRGHRLSVRAVPAALAAALVRLADFYDGAAA
jgi:hypothetical protein